MSSTINPGHQNGLARSLSAVSAQAGRLSREVAACHGDDPSLFLYYRVVFAFQPCQDGKTRESGTEEYLKVAGYFEKVGQELRWQKLAAAELVE